MYSETELKMDYHHWANMKMLNHLKNLKEEVFLQEVKSIFPSISIIFSHIYQVDHIWIKRILGKSESVIEVKTFDSPLISLKYFEQLYQQYKNLSFKDRKIIYKNTMGEIFQSNFQDIIQHVMNHGTYHRGNVSAILHQLGQKSVSTDYIYYLREGKEQ
jgi:uncharacterized damage-inducible protein DinB